MTAAKIKEILIEARRLLAEVGWCQKSWARKNGGPVSALDPSADAYCAMGALCAASDKLGGLAADFGAVRHALHFSSYDVTKDGGHYSVMSFNDEKGRTKEQVLGLFDHAIGKMP